jgi:hypothetical protein
MASVVFRCPNTLKKTQGWTVDDPSDDSDAYVPQQCIACRQIHYVNPKSGQVLGDAEDE